MHLSGLCNALPENAKLVNVGSYLSFPPWRFRLMRCKAISARFLSLRGIQSGGGSVGQSRLDDGLHAPCRHVVGKSLYQCPNVLSAQGRVVQLG